MRLPFQSIAILVVLSLVGILAYQAYWLISMYHTLGEQAEVTIRAAIKNADHIELFMRADSVSEQEKKHRITSANGNIKGNGEVNGEVAISFSTSFSKDDNGEMRQSALIKEVTDPDGNKTISKEEEEKRMYPSNPTEAVVGENISSLYTMVTELQQGLHAAIDDSVAVNLVKFDSILNHDLLEANLRIRHYTQAIDIQADSILSSTLPAGIDTLRMNRYDYVYSRKDSCTYRVFTEPTGTVVLHQMSGILTTSFCILLVLSFAFWYLIRTILRQKTLEEITSDFTSNITHELKTPIAVAYAANDALLNFNQAEEKAKRDKYLQIGQEQLQRLSALVEQILSMSMEQRKTFRLHPESVQLRELIAPLLEQHKLKADRPLIIACDILPEELHVTADRTHLSNIISNLIDNAVKYSPERANVTIRCHQVGEKVEINVTDQGIGIPADKQKLIFDKFYRVHTGNLHDVKGYGLGLYYVWTMMEKHGGTVSVTSTPRQGSTFTLRL